MGENDSKVDYSKVKTHGGVTTTPDGDTHPTSLSDDGRAAHVAALKNERATVARRVGAEGDDAPASAKRRLAEIDKELDRFKDRPARGAVERA